MHLHKQFINNILAWEYNNIIYILTLESIRLVQNVKNSSFNYFFQKECMTFLHTRHEHSFL